MPSGKPRRKIRLTRVITGTASSLPARSGIKPRAKPDLATLAGNIPMLGDVDAPILIVLDPVVGNLHAKKPFDKRQFEWLTNHLKESGGFNRSDVMFVSAAPPVTGETWKQNKLINTHLKEHYEEFHRIVEALNPKLIVPAGAKACQQVIGRAVQITKSRGQVIQSENICNGVPILPLLSPFYAQRHPETESVFKTDIATIGRLHKADYSINKSMAKASTNYRWCWDLRPLLLKKPKRISLDVETKGLRPYEKGNKLLTVQICYAEGEVLNIPIDYDSDETVNPVEDRIWHRGHRNRIVKQLRRLLEDPEVEVIGQNLKYDWLWLKYALDIEIANYKHDTILLAHLHDENVLTQNIDDLVRIHVPEMAGYNDVLNVDPEHQGKTRMDLLSAPKMLIYGSGDADAALRLCDELLKLNMQDTGIMNTYNHVTMPAQRAFCYIEQNGFPIDIKALNDFEKMLAEHQRVEKRRLLNMIPREIRDEFRHTGVGLKPDRTAILKAYLYRPKKMVQRNGRRVNIGGLGLKPVAYTKTGEPSVSSKQAMPYYAADHPFCAAIIDYIKNEKLLGTYTKGFYKYIVDSIIRPSYLLFRTVTGRSASQDPNGQNFPKRGKLVKAYRKIFRAPKGWVFLSNDLSQAELRVAAMMSGDETMLEVYRNGGDIHTRTAMGVMGIDTIEEWNELPADVRDLKRFQAKAVNFGFLYGMWWVKFRSYAKTEYGIDFTEDEAKEIREMFFRTYPRLEDWHRAIIDYVNEHGYVRTYDGRVRHLPMVFSDDEAIVKEAQRQAINSPVQAIASDLGLMALGRLIPYIKKHNLQWIKVCGFIHDAIVCLVREDHAAEGAALVKRFMETNPTEKWFGWTPEVPIISDAEVGRTLAKMYGLKNDRFVPKNMHDKSYADLVHEIADDLEAKAATTTDAEKKANLIKDVAAARDDAGPRQTKRRRIIRTVNTHTNLRIVKTVRKIRVVAKTSKR